MFVNVKTHKLWHHRPNTSASTNLTQIAKDWQTNIPLRRSNDMFRCKSGSHAHLAYPTVKI